MTRGQMRTWLQINLRDTAAIEWSVTELNDLINQAYALVQKELVKVNAGYHRAWDYSTVTAGTNWYPLPPTFGLKRLAYKATASQVGYTKLEKKNLDDIEALTGGGPFYAREGLWVGIFPAPTVTVADGLEFLHSPIYALADDDEVPRIKTPLHIAIMWWAKVLATGETDESNVETRQRINEVLGDIPLWYDVMQDGPDVLQIDF